LTLPDVAEHKLSGTVFRTKNGTLVEEIG